MRHALFEAANSHLRRSKKWSTVRAWGVKLAKRVGAKKACVAVARKLAIIMHRMWVDETDFRFGQPPTAKTAQGSSRRSDLLCRGRGEGQSVTIPVRCTHQARAVSLDDLTRRTPSWSNATGRLRTEARARHEQLAATIVTRRGGDAARLRSRARARE